MLINPCLTNGLPLGQINESLPSQNIPDQQNKNENSSKLTAVLTAITVKNCCHWRYRANKTASLQAQNKRRKTSTNNQPKPRCLPKEEKTSERAQRCMIPVS